MARVWDHSFPFFLWPHAVITAFVAAAAGRGWDDYSLMAQLLWLQAKTPLVGGSYHLLHGNHWNPERPTAELLGASDANHCWSR
jgi:hypothetical protein